MPFANTMAYKQSVARRKFDSPVKLRHIWIPLVFFLITLYRNQAISQLSLPEGAVGLSIATISFLPLFIWASKPNREVPAFQCFCAVHFPFFAYPVISCKDEYMTHPEPDRLLAGITVLVFLVVANLVYYVGMTRQGTAGPGKLLAYRELPEKSARSLFTFLLVVWSLFNVLRIFGLMPPLGSISNTVTSFACGGGIVAVWILSRQIGQRKLSRGHQAFVLILIGATFAIMVATASLIAVFTMLIVGVVGYSLNCPKVPWVLIITSLLMMSFLNLGKGEIRRLFWAGGMQNFLTVPKIIDIYRIWPAASWNALCTGRDVRGQKAQHLLDRANLIHIQALVVQNTPSRMPFLFGETYKYIPLNLVPRFVWPEKPHTHMATEILGLHYKVTSRGSLRTTTVGFGYLPEAWANFGWIGVIGLALIIGFTMQAVARACYGAHPYSLHSLLSVVWVAWSFQIELPMSTWFSSFAQAVFAILVICYLFSHKENLIPRLNAAYSAG